ARAREALDRDNLTPEEQKFYDYLQHIRSDNLSYFASAKAVGETIGREKGRAERERLAAELKERERELEKERREHEKRERELEEERVALLAEITRLKQNGKLN
ncbi:MAG: hypothetical protein LBL24_10005, partial [Bacteroidales bacterium]|nr:hypothetical protein [Bacteroidales bacterium]